MTATGPLPALSAVSGRVPWWPGLAMPWSRTSGRATCWSAMPGSSEVTGRSRRGVDRLSARGRDRSPGADHPIHVPVYNVYNVYNAEDVYDVCILCQSLTALTDTGRHPLVMTVGEEVREGVSVPTSEPVRLIDGDADSCTPQPAWPRVSGRERAGERTRTSIPEGTGT